HGISYGRIQKETQNSRKESQTMSVCRPSVGIALVFGLMAVANTSEEKESEHEVSVDQLTKSVHLVGKTGVRHGTLALFSGKWREERVLRGPRFVFEIHSINGTRVREKLEFRRDDITFHEDLADHELLKNGRLVTYYGFETGRFFGVPK